jgi:hypothetical protein
MISQEIDIEYYAFLLDQKIAIQNFPVLISSDSIYEYNYVVSVIVSLQILLCQIRWIAALNLGLLSDISMANSQISSEMKFSCPSSL